MIKSFHVNSPCSNLIIYSFFNLEIPLSAIIKGLKTLPPSVEIITDLYPSSFLMHISRGNSPPLLFSLTELTNSHAFFTEPIKIPLKKTSTASLPSLINPNETKSFTNLSSSKLTFVETLLKIAKFFLKPISVPSGVSIGQNLP